MLAPKASAITRLGDEEFVSFLEGFYIRMYLVLNHVGILTMHVLMMSRAHRNKISRIIIAAIVIVMVNGNDPFLWTTYALFGMKLKARCFISVLRPVPVT